MSVSQTILFTVLPRGIDVDGKTKPVSVLVSPRLEGADRLGAFDDWLSWTRHLHDDGLELEFRSGTHRLVRPVEKSVLRPKLWAELFDAETFVRSHATLEDYATREVISFPVRETLSALKSVYQRASIELALPDTRATDRARDQGNRQRLANLVDGLQFHWDGREARKLRHSVRQGLSENYAVSGPSPSSGPLDADGLLRGGAKSSLGALSLPFSVYHHMPTPPYGEHGIQLPDTSKLIDFHQALTALNGYPSLLRALGLVFDLELPNDFFATTPFDAPGSVRVEQVRPGWHWAIEPEMHPLATAYLLLEFGGHQHFFAAPRAAASRPAVPGVPAEPIRPGGVFGLLDLDPGHFGLAQVDVDGAMHKAIMLAETLHPSGEHNLVPNATPAPAPHPDVFDPEATLPALRSGGFSLFADRRAVALLQSIHDAKAFNAALAAKGPLERPFYAEDLTRGYRLDIWDSRTNAWHSLHRRHAKYRVGELPFEAKGELDEGFVELAATQAAPGAKNSDGELYLHEAIARWAGFSLSVPRPGVHLSRYADASDALPRPGEDEKFEENAAVTPFRVAADYELIPGSLPALRFGVRYRLRARAVDLAGNGLHFDDVLADNAARAFALPRDPEGFAYLRFEPVPAPLVVVLDEGAVSDPGSAVDRLVIRSFNDDISKDGDAADLASSARHILPPRAAIEMGERHGTFDDAAGKLKGDAATWGLIAQRDAGELARKKISIKGRLDPVTDDGSNLYPVEPRASVDPLPYFPDPLARGAALRDLPGTPSGTLGRAVPGAGSELPIAYDFLSDPNPRPGSATLVSFDESGDWEKVRGFRLVLAEPPAGASEAAPSYDPVARALTVFLPKGESRVVPLTSTVSPDDLNLMGVWQWLREHVEKLVDAPAVASLRPGSTDDQIAHVLQRAVEGGHWMLTPPHLLTLVHAVQQPIGRPRFSAVRLHHEARAYAGIQLQTTPGRGATDPSELAAITAWRRPDATDAYLLGALAIHGASTGRIDLTATWDDPVDDLELPSWTTTHHAAPVDELPLPTLEEKYLDAPGKPERHVGRYDPAHDQVLFVRAFDNTTWEDRDFEDAAPRHLFNDTKHHVVTYTATASSRYREYFDPELDPSAFTRTSAPVVVDVPASARPLAPDVAYVVPTFGWERQVSTNLKRSVRFGGGLRVYLQRPWFSSGAGELLGVTLWSDANGALDPAARDKLKAYFTQWGMDPIWQSQGLNGAPDVSSFPDAEAADKNVSLDEATAHRADGSRGRVSVVGFSPQYDAERKLWFADLTLNLPSETYMPFVRLALVRYQPHALQDAKISRVVLADFAQLTPDRSAMVSADPHHPRTIRVVVSGVAPRGPMAIVQPDTGHSSASARPTQVRVRVQRHDDTIDSDLAWHDVPPAVAAIDVTRDGPVSGNADLALWAGTVQFAKKPAPGAFRLLIEEFEHISANYTVEGAPSDRPGRLIYAEIVTLDEALVGE